MNTLGEHDLSIQRDGIPFLQFIPSPNTIVSLAGIRADNGMFIPVGQTLEVNSIINPLNNDVIVDATLTNNAIFRENAVEQLIKGAQSLKRTK